MLIERRKYGSHQDMMPISGEGQPNLGGQGGSLSITMLGSDGVRYTPRPETLEDVKGLMYQAHIIHHNFKEPKK
jgi:hypothetical protein